tara:strand:- start:1781 stop:2095 length:315 start_codon:yes stop_codon:yes gene_type:complete
MLGIAQIMIGEALVDAGTPDWLGRVIQGTGSGTLALGIYFLLFLARNESEFKELYSKAEKTIMVTDHSGKKHLVDDSSKPVKAIWYSIPVGMAFLGLVSLLING